MLGRAFTLGCIITFVACASSEESGGGGAGNAGKGGSVATGGSDGSAASGGTGAISSGGTGASAGASAGGGGTAGSSTGGQSGSAGSGGVTDAGVGCPLGPPIDASCSGVTATLTKGTRACVLELPSLPGGQGVDPDLLNITILTGTALEFLGNVCTAADCATHEKGWYFDDNQQPTQVILCPDVCPLLNGVTAQGIATVGCPTTAASPK